MAPMRNVTGIAIARSATSSTHPPPVNHIPASAIPATASTTTTTTKVMFPLQRGSACLSCRKRKMKCDAGKPVCQQCVKGNRPGECEYDDGKSKSRTQMLQEKVNKLQEKVKELETRPSRTASSTPPSPGMFVYQQQQQSPAHQGYSNQQQQQYQVDPTLSNNLAQTHLQSAPLYPSNQASTSGYGYQDPHAHSGQYYSSDPHPHPSASVNSNQNPNVNPAYIGQGHSRSSSHGSGGSGGSGSGSVLDYTGHGQGCGVSAIPPNTLSAQAHGHGGNVHAHPHSMSQSAPNSGVSPTLWGFGESPVMNTNASSTTTSTPTTYPTSATSGIAPGAWWEQEDLTPHWRQVLLDLFFPHAHQSSFYVHVPSFVHAVQSPSIPPSGRPHPALMNGIYLLGVHYSRLEGSGAGISSLSSDTGMGMGIGNGGPGSAGALPHPDILESIFLDRALFHLSAALETGDRLVNVIQASCLLATWFFGKGRLLEGYYHSSSAGRLVVGLGLHQVRGDGVFEQRPSSSSSSSGRSSAAAFPPSTFPTATPPQTKSHQNPFQLQGQTDLLPPCTSRMELGERILTFWQVFTVDRAWAIATNLPSGLVDDDDHPRTRVMSVWPRGVGEYLGMSAKPRSRSGKTPSPPPTLTGGNVSVSAEEDSLFALRAKATALFERASKLSSHYESISTISDSSAGSSHFQGTTHQMDSSNPAGIDSNSRRSPTPLDKYWSDFRSLQFAITRFTSSLPPIPQKAIPPTMPVSAIQELEAERATMVLVHTLAQTAMIQLHHTFSGKDMSAHERCVESAGVVVRLIGRLDVEDYGYLDPFIGTCWLIVSDVLIREHIRRSQLPQRISPLDVTSTNANAAQLTLVNSQLDSVMGALGRFAGVFPLASYQLGKVEQRRVEAGGWSGMIG